jgi:anaerobic nitric oxide reductase transcription regulator
VLAATNRDLAEEVRAGRFRADLYHRLSVYPLKVPTLHERGRDVLLLAGYFLEENRARLGLRSLRLSSEAQKALLAHDWPGNVRELEHLIGRAALKALSACGERPRILSIDTRALDLPDSQPATPDPTPSAPAEHNSLPLREALDAYQKQLISQTLDRHQHKWAPAARELGIDRANLIRLAKRLGLQ